eukprot:TRINITY_DN14251_c0_g1_i1.p1 TRINITY_DN14251_c0_g1~~TRINITY_DN14251_c0_g1_i1.p1  ORF type:complete len:186 (+),score=93.85 TRINITY_DN14251_c0_g1_i1:55-612(+)
MPKRGRDSMEAMTELTNDSAEGGMQQAMTAMEQFMVGKKQKRHQKVGELHNKLMHRVKGELEDMSAVIATTREGVHSSLKDKVELIKASSAELSRLEEALKQKYRDMEQCLKALEDLSAKRAHTARKRETAELDHRQLSVELFRKLKNDIGDLLDDCVKNLQKNYESTSQMKKMRAFLEQLENAA